jgi:hypothetical protein
VVCKNQKKNTTKKKKIKKKPKNNKKKNYAAYDAFNRLNFRVGTLLGKKYMYLHEVLL